ncbi:MAG: YqhA family protein [Prochlorococcus sp.]|nr:YqhA family protein [Prochlorococcaceae cyanobacterium Fu_MAG_50]
MRFNSRAFERSFELMIWRFRLVSVLPVIMSLLGSVACFVLGTIEELHAFSQLLHGKDVEEHASELLGNMIGGIDYYVIGIALLIFGYGIYELVISDIDARQDMVKERRSNLLSIDSLETLKQKLTNVIVVALIVSAFKTMIEIPIGSITELLQFCGCVTLLALSAWLIVRSHEGE